MLTEPHTLNGSEGHKDWFYGFLNEDGIEPAGRLAVVFLSSHNKQKKSSTSGLWIDSVINPINHQTTGGFHIWDDSSDLAPYLSHLQTWPWTSHTRAWEMEERWNSHQTIARECISATIAGFVLFHLPHIRRKKSCFHKSITSGLVLANGVRQGIYRLGYLAAKIKDALFVKILRVPLEI